MSAKEFIETYIDYIDVEDLEYVIELAFLNLNRDEWDKFVKYMYTADIDIQDAGEHVMLKSIHGALQDYITDNPEDTFLEYNEKIKRYIHGQLNNDLGLTLETIDRLIDRAIIEIVEE